MATMSGSYPGQTLTPPKLTLTPSTQINLANNSATNNQQLNDLIRALGQPTNYSLPAPTYQPPDLNEVNSLRKRQAELKKLSEDPFSDVGLQQTLQSVAGGLARGEQQALGAAQGRAAATGQAGFAGAFAGSAAALSAARAATLGETRGKLAGDLSMKSRDQELALGESIMQAQLQAENIATQRAQVEQQAQIAQMQAALQGRTSSASALASVLSNRESLAASTNSDNLRALLAQQELGLKGTELTASLAKQQQEARIERERFAAEKADRVTKEEERLKQKKLDDQLQALALIQVQTQREEAEKALNDRIRYGTTSTPVGGYTQAQTEYLKKKYGSLSL